MSDFSSILDHPQSREIISKLVTGTSPKDVCNWLKIKYPDKDQSHLRLNQKLLKEFADSQYTQYYEQVIEAKDIIATGSKDNHLRMSAALANNKFYRERIEEVVHKEIDFYATIETTLANVHARLEQLFDLTQQDSTDVGKADHTLIKYVNLFIENAEKLQKMKTAAVNPLAEHNLSAQALNEYILAMQNAVRKTMAEVSPDMASIFMDKLNDEMSTLKVANAMSQDEKLKAANEAKATLISISD